MGYPSKITADERDHIACWHAAGVSNKEIGRRLGRYHTSIDRELKRNEHRGDYTAVAAQKLSERRNHLSRKRNALKDQKIYAYVVEKLRTGWSPEQIAGRLKKEHKKTVLCHETIYRYIYFTPDGKKQELYDYLPRHRHKRRIRYGRSMRHPQIPERVSIHDRPEEVNSKKVFGHWELDAVEGKGHKEAIATFLERVSRYYQAVKMSNLDAEETIKAHLSVLGMFPEFARKSATFDNGKENTNHPKLWQYYGILTYFCDPYCSWQKGSNENHNGLLRRYIPKKTDLTTVYPHELKAIVTEINNRPRKCLNYATPKEVFCYYLKQKKGKKCLTGTPYSERVV